MREGRAVKEGLRKGTAEGGQRGVFGAPFVFVDGEPLWGSDGMWMIDKWLERGGW